MRVDQEEGVTHWCSGECSEDGRPVRQQELEGLVTREFSGVEGRDLVTQVEGDNDAMQLWSVDRPQSGDGARQFELECDKTQSFSDRKAEPQLEELSLS